MHLEQLATSNQINSWYTRKSRKGIQKPVSLGFSDVPSSEFRFQGSLLKTWEVVEQRQSFLQLMAESDQVFRPMSENFTLFQWRFDLFDSLPEANSSNFAVNEAETLTNAKHNRLTVPLLRRLILISVETTFTRIGFSFLR